MVSSSTKSRWRPGPQGVPRAQHCLTLMLGQSAPLARSQAMQNQKERLKYQVDVLAIQSDLACWGIGQQVILLILTEEIKSSGIGQK